MLAAGCSYWLCWLCVGLLLLVGDVVVHTGLFVVVALVVCAAIVILYCCLFLELQLIMRFVMRYRTASASTI